MRIGVISDTHGFLRPQALEALKGVSLIIHAGDIGSPEILEKLSEIAPVKAVRGNTDRGEWALALPQTEVVEVGEVRIYVLHDLHALDLAPKAAGFAAVVFGHSHRPHLERKNGVLFLNPGSAGPRRFTLPVCLAYLKVQENSLEAEFVPLDMQTSKTVLPYGFSVY
ncbi:MAG: metallophosphoesterase [Deltaproteobacteria bacterium]|nr:MAG: metallophosphoesterase [Deltaproteobacteria bacterium]